MEEGEIWATDMNFQKSLVGENLLGIVF